MNKMLPFVTLAVIALGWQSNAPGEAVPTSRPASTITLATYNIEHFADHFRGFHMEKRAATQPDDPEMKGLISYLKRTNTENQWEIANVINDPAFSPDILCIEEGPDQSDLEYFNKKWLNGMYAKVIVFPSNTLYHQTVGMLLKPGFEVVERRDQYYREPDPGNNPRGDRLFARGPAFVLACAPTSYTFWIGVTHQKSKSGNNLPVTQWRNREAKRTHEILEDLEHSKTHDVILLGDMNDDVGLDEYEKKPKSGGDAMATLVGPSTAPSSTPFVLVTKPLVDRHEISFHGYNDERHRSLIDHAIASPEIAPRIKSVEIFHNSWTQVASDHFPLLLHVDAGNN